MSKPRRLAVLDGDPAVEQAHDTLVEAGDLEPVGPGDAEQERWVDCDLAAFAENRLGERFDPRALDTSRRADVMARATTDRLWTPAAREGVDHCYWLLASGRRAGAVALAKSTLGSSSLRLSSLYVFPTERGQGIGRRSLERIRDALGEHGHGIRLDTCWTWQRTLRFYLACGMWARMWKRDIELTGRAGAPNPIVDFGEHRASLSVTVDDETITLVTAERDGERLRSFAHVQRDRAERDPRLADVLWNADTTLAVALALRGWPLLASPQTWQDEWHGDAGHPEGLAHRIIIWEAWARHHGWRVDTPRIPALPYRTWAKLEAEWAAP